MYRRARRFEATFPDFSEVVQTSRERLQVSGTHVDAGGLTVHRVRFSAGFQFRCDVPPGRAVLAFAESDAQLVEHGRPWPPGTFALIGGHGVDVFSLGAAEIVWIEFPSGGRRPAADSRAPRSTEHGCEFLTCDESLAELLKSAAQTGGAALPVALDAVLGGARRLAQRPALNRRYRLVLDAEAFMAEHVDEGPLLETLGAQLGCSARTLIYAFTQVFGIGPMAYFKLQRLNAIHRRLSTGDALKISELAPRYGFRHMGHFSTDYRLMFGQPPSQSRESRA